MEKKLQFIMLFLGFLGSSQIGINTANPNSTFDISVKRNATGELESNSKHIGIQAPRITLAELTDTTAVYGANQVGSIIYITAVSSGSATESRINIDTVGYYYFDGTLWQKLEGSNDNIYNVDGELTDTRTLDYNDKLLQFGLESKGQTVNFNQTTGLYIKKPTSGFRSSLGLSSGNGTLWLFNDENSSAQLVASGTTKSLVIGTTNSTDAATVRFMTSPGANVLGNLRMQIAGNGNVGIGGNAAATEKLQINEGTIRVPNLPANGATNAINTNSAGVQTSSQNQTFTATRTMVVNNQGVLGYVDGLPQSLKITRVTLPTESATLPPDSNTTAYTNIYVDIPPGVYKLDISLGLTLTTRSTYTVGSNFIRLRIANSETPVSLGSFSSDALYPRYASQGFAFSQSQGVVTGSLVVKNSTSAVKRYYIHIDNGASNGYYQQVVVNNSWNESSLVYYPVTND